MAGVTDALCRVLATGFGTGCAPRGRGTIGTLGAALAYAGAYHLGWTDGWRGIAWAAGISALCIPVGNRIVRISGIKDPPWFVLDEFAGMFATMIGLSWGPWWRGLALGFVWFRVFDIVKPPPCRRLEHAPGGWGILLDDLMAAVYAQGVCRAVIWIDARWGWWPWT